MVVVERAPRHVRPRIGTGRERRRDVPRLRWLLLALLLLFGAVMPGAASAEKRPLRLEDIFGSGRLDAEPLSNLRWRDAGTVTYARPGEGGSIDIMAFDARTRRHRPLLSAGMFRLNGAAVPVASYEWSGGGRYLLLGGPPVTTWDGQREGPFYLFDMASRSLRPVGGGKALRNVALSPDGSRIGYAYANNLHVAALSDLAERAVTTDGSADVFNGVFDYGSSEFGFERAWKWSPDGRRIGFWRLDASEVPTYAMVDELGGYPEVRRMKYPNVAERHAVARIGVYDLASSRTSWMDTGRDPDDYIPQIDWAQGGRSLLIQRLTRDHKRLDLLLADSATGASRTLYSETDPAWIDVTEDLTVSAAGDRFVWTSERDGFRHAYLFDLTGRYTRLTRGDWEITSLAGWDERAGWLYFYGKKDRLVDQHVYRVKLDGTGQTRVSGRSGWHEWLLSPDGRNVVASFSTIASPPRIDLLRSDGSQVAEISAGRAGELAGFDMPRPELTSFVTSDGVRLDAYMIKPTNFDPKKVYPVIAYGYGNAGSQVVSNRWGSGGQVDRFLWHLYMAQQGFLVFSADNRTTAGRGKAAKNLTYGHYAKYAVSDQLEAARYLQSLPIVDRNRIGFWGWSGGAYLACAVMTKGAPAFKVGISVAPVIDLSRYQAVGVERWMGQLEDNPTGYYETNLLNYADRMQGKLLLIHGTGDENVKPAFTLQFADALIRAGKQFDMMMYPNQHHRLEGVRRHVYTKMADYFRDNL